MLSVLTDNDAVIEGSTPFLFIVSDNFHYNFIIEKNKKKISKLEQYTVNYIVHFYICKINSA